MKADNFPALVSGPARILLASLLSLVTTAPGLMAGVTAPSAEMKAHLFFAEEDDQMLPIVGVQSQDKVIVQLENQELKTVKTNGAAFLVKNLPPAGRVTILDTAGMSSTDTTLSSNYLTKFSRTTVDIDLVSDTSLEDAYVALFLMPPEEDGQELVTFCPIGDLEAGKVESKYIYFPNIGLTNGWRYRFELYCKGFPLEMYRLEHVADVSGSQGLRIPWKERIKCYLRKARQHERTVPPKAFQISFNNLDLVPCRNRGLDTLNLKLKIFKNGSVEILGLDTSLTTEEVEHLQRDAAEWYFFPAIRDGDPMEVVVKLPLRI